MPEEKVEQAREILIEMSAIPPQLATADTVVRLSKAVDLLEENEGVPLWFIACDLLASHYLEVKAGDHHENVMAARDIYSSMVAQAQHTGTFDEWFTAHMGLCNTILFDSAVTADDISTVIQLYDGILPVVRENGTPMQTAMTLGYAADAYSRTQGGDIDAMLETAIRLQSEAIQLLSDLDDPDVDERMAHAQYNLGKFYSERRTGLRSQNVDIAIKAFISARDLRPKQVNPLGRARVERALSLLIPEWSATQSKDEADQLASEAEQEANMLVSENTEFYQYENPVYNNLQSSQAALRIDFDWLYKEPVDHRRKILEGYIDNHRSVIAGIDRAAMPAAWAEWMAGLGMLLGRLSHVGASKSELATAKDCFEQASKSINAAEQHRLYRDIMSGWGEFSHEIGDYETSYHAYSEAVEISRHILAEVADPEHRLLEIEKTRGYGLFGAYAAVQLNLPDHAAVLAELECNRGNVDLLCARWTMSNATQEQRSEIKEVLGQIKETERQLKMAGQQTGDALVQDMRARLADSIGAHPSIIQMRLIESGNEITYTQNVDQEVLRKQLIKLNQYLRLLLTPSEQSVVNEFSPHLDVDEIKRIAKDAGQTLVYLLATLHGAAAIVVQPSDSIKILNLPDMTSDLTGKLLEGEGQLIGFRDIQYQEFDKVNACLVNMENTLRQYIMVPLNEFLRSQGNTDNFVIIALGRLGLLPLHLAAAPCQPLSYAPSAKALTASMATVSRPIDDSVLVVADPIREETERLVYAVAEGRWIISLGDTDRQVTMLSGQAPSYDKVKNAAGDAAVIHFGCHGKFRPSAPMESLLALAGEDELNLYDLFFCDIDLGQSRLVTLGVCDSGLTEYYRASDEATGFPMGMMISGVPAIVSAMWPVDDAATMMFMTEFYRLLLCKKVELSYAMAQACDWLRTASTQKVILRIEELKRCLLTEDEAVAEKLDQLAAELKLYGINSVPFKSPADWGAFCITGV